MSNWQFSKYMSIIALHNDAAKNSLWRSTSALRLRTNNNNSKDRKRKEAALTPCFKKANGTSGSFNNHGRKDFSDKTMV